MFMGIDCLLSDYHNKDDKQEWLVKEITSHRWLNSKELELKVRWMLGDTTWEPLASCKDLKALDAYFKSFLWLSQDHAKVNLFGLQQDT